MSAANLRAVVMVLLVEVIIRIIVMATGIIIEFGNALWIRGNTDYLAQMLIQ